MYEVRRIIDLEDGRQNVKVWFNIETREEAEQIIFDNALGEVEHHYKNGVGADHWCNGYNMGLWRFKENLDRYELDNEIGPSTEAIYLIEMYGA